MKKKNLYTIKFPKFVYSSFILAGILAIVLMFIKNTFSYENIVLILITFYIAHLWYIIERLVIKYNESEWIIEVLDKKNKEISNGKKE